MKTFLKVGKNTLNLTEDLSKGLGLETGKKSIKEVIPTLKISDVASRIIAIKESAIRCMLLKTMEETGDNAEVKENNFAKIKDVCKEVKSLPAEEGSSVLKVTFRKAGEEAHFRLDEKLVTILNYIVKNKKKGYVITIDEFEKAFVLSQKSVFEEILAKLNVDSERKEGFFKYFEKNGCLCK